MVIQSDSKVKCITSKKTFVRGNSNLKTVADSSLLMKKNIRYVSLIKINQYYHESTLVQSNTRTEYNNKSPMSHEHLPPVRPKKPFRPVEGSSRRSTLFASFP